MPPDFDQLLRNIETMAAKDDLVAAIVHLNDTYLLEGNERTTVNIP